MQLARVSLLLSVLCARQILAHYTPTDEKVELSLDASADLVVNGKDFKQPAGQKYIVPVEPPVPPAADVIDDPITDVRDTWLRAACQQDQSCYTPLIELIWEVPRNSTFDFAFIVPQPMEVKDAGERNLFLPRDFRFKITGPAANSAILRGAIRRYRHLIFGHIPPHTAPHVRKGLRPVFSKGLVINVESGDEKVSGQT